MYDAERLSLCLQSETPRPIALDDVAVAVGALLVRVARSDGEYIAVEMAEIDRILALRMRLDQEAAMELRHLCETVETTAPSTERFATIIRDGVPYSARLSIAMTLWDVMMADGIRRREEADIVALAERILGVLPTDMPRDVPEQS